MANTYTQIYIHIVFAVKGRKNLLKKEHKEELHKFITGIIRNKNPKLIAINSMPDHVHIFIGMKPDIASSDLVRDIKTIHQRLSIAKDGYEENSIGRKVTAHSLTDTHR